MRTRLPVASAALNRRLVSGPTVSLRERGVVGALDLALDLGLADDHRLEPGGHPVQVARGVAVAVRVDRRREAGRAGSPPGLRASPAPCSRPRPGRRRRGTARCGCRSRSRPPPGRRRRRAGRAGTPRRAARAAPGARAPRPAPSCARRRSPAARSSSSPVAHPTGSASTLANLAPRRPARACRSRCSSTRSRSVRLSRVAMIAT